MVSFSTVNKKQQVLEKRGKRKNRKKKRNRTYVYLLQLGSWTAHISFIKRISREILLGNSVVELLTETSCRAVFGDDFPVRGGFVAEAMG